MMRIPVLRLHGGLGSKMQAAVESFIFALLACSFTSAQECLRKDITYDHIQTVGLSESYESGDKVRVNCGTGYTGFYKLSCEKGRWKQDAGRECKKRPCGHPGDTPNGDFKLTQEKEFVFGATVEYTCRPGYIMASRINTRNCRSQGWDNAVPVCEVVKCPAILTTGDVIATGNIEEASFDDVIHFECASHRLMLDGPQDIHCTERGTWSAPVPKCIEIRCQQPQILHGFITNPEREYKENEQLKYTCEENYRPRHGIPRCLRSGWSITPECEEITCLLGPRTLGIISTRPEGKNVFRVGETVEITCSESYWVIGTRLTKRTIRCTRSGDWEHSPVCEESSCDVPFNENVYYPTYYFRGDKRLGVSKSYQCESGYRQEAEKATCTENGWSPKPLCVEIACSKPTIPNAEAVKELKSTYKPNEHVQFRCLRAYESSTFYITCNYNGHWDNTRRCPDLSTCPKPVAIEHGVIKEPLRVQNYYQKESTVEYQCSEGFVFQGEPFARCVVPNWIYPKCIRDDCGAFTLKNGFAHYYLKDSDSPKPSHSLFYSCNEGYKTFEDTWWGETSCSQGVLAYTPQCIRNDECGRFPNITHGKLIQKNKVHSKGEQVALECDFGYRADTPYITCNNGTWTNQKCTRIIDDNCGPPPRAENAVIGSYEQKSYQKTATFKCRDHFVSTLRPMIECIRKGWQKAPTCQLSPSACTKPDMEKFNSTIKEPQKIMDYYGAEERVEYKCSEGYMFEKETSARCTERKWVYPTCILKPVEEKPDLDQPDSKPSPSAEPSLGKIEDEEKVKTDQPATTPSRDSEARTESATSVGCGRPPLVPHAIHDFKERYEDGERATYDCPAYYIQEGDSYLTCRQGRWIGKAKCLEPCTVDVQDLDKNNIELRKGGREKIYAKHLDYITFVCKRGYRRAVGSIELRQQCSYGEISLPVCE